MKMLIVDAKEMEHSINPRQSEYYKYLDNHIRGVQLAWEQFLRPVVVKEFWSELANCTEAIQTHDASKYELDEFLPYCDYFYPSEGFEANEYDFNEAWLLHQHRNPHHWQYWVLINDVDETVLMDMPFAEIINMLCDWHSFSGTDPLSTALVWYEENKENILISDNTRNWVEYFLQYLSEPIQME